MLPTEMVDSFKDHLHAGDNFWSGVQIWRRLFDSQQTILRYIVKEDPSFFVETHDISLVSGQAEYDLPLNARLGSKIIFAENRDNPSGAEMPWAELDDYTNFADPGVINLVPDTHITLHGSKVRVMPEPTKTLANAIRVWFSPMFGNMIQGTASAGGTSTLTVFSGNPNYSTNHGWKDVRDDYYNDMNIILTGGTGVGQTNKISDYAGSTGILTMDENWSTTPDNTTTFAIICPVPEDHHPVVVTHAAMTAATKSPKRSDVLRRQFYGYIGAPGELKEMLGWIRSRQSAKGRTVRPVDLGE